MSAFNKTFGNSFGRTFRPIFETVVAGEAIVRFLAAWADAAGVSQTLLTGTGPVTTDHDEAILAPDHEGVYREFAVDAPVRKDGRVVENSLLQSNTFSTSPWSLLSGGTGNNPVLTSGLADPEGGTDAWRFQADAAGASGIGDYALLRQTVSAINNNDNIYTIWVKSNTAASQDFSFLYTGGETRTATTEWQRFTIDYSATSSIFDFGIRGDLSDDTLDLLIYSAQIEVATGRSDTTTPSEYIATTTAPVQKVFSYANGNTVDGNGVVTEARGADFADAPYLVAQPEGANSSVSSNDVTSSPWAYRGGSETHTFDQIGLKGLPNTASLIKVGVSGADDIWHNDVTIYTAGTLFGFKIYLKRSTAGGTLSVQITWNQGDWAIDTSQLPLNEFVMITPSHSAVTENFPGIADGTHALTTYFRGDAGLTECTIGNFEIHIDETESEVKSLGPIFTTSAAATTSAFDNEYPAANHSNTEGPYYLEFENTGDDVVLMSAGTDEFLRIEDGGSVEEVANGDFALWTDPTFPDGWNLTITDANTYVEEHAQGMRFVSDGGNLSLGQSSIVTTGNTYEVEIGVVSTTGDVTIRLATTAELGVTYVAVKTAGLHTFILTADGTSVSIVRSGAGTDMVISHISIKEVDGKYLKLTDGTTQLQAACAAGEHKAGIAFDADNNLMNLNLDGTWADLTDSTAYDGTLGSGVLTLGETERNVKRWNETDLTKQKDIIDEEMS